MNWQILKPYIDDYELLGICYCGNCKVSQTFFTISIMFLTKVLSFYCSPEHAANNSVYKNTNYSPQRTIREKSLKPIIRFTLAVISKTLARIPRPLNFKIALQIRMYKQLIYNHFCWKFDITNYNLRKNRSIGYQFKSYQK